MSARACCMSTAPRQSSRQSLARSGLHAALFIGRWPTRRPGHCAACPRSSQAQDNRCATPVVCGVRGVEGCVVRRSLGRLLVKVACDVECGCHAEGLADPAAVVAGRVGRGGGPQRSTQSRARGARDARNGRQAAAGGRHDDVFRDARARIVSRRGPRASAAVPSTIVSAMTASSAACPAAGCAAASASNRSAMFAACADASAPARRALEDAGSPSMAACSIGASRWKAARALARRSRRAARRGGGRGRRRRCRQRRPATPAGAARPGQCVGRPPARLVLTSSPSTSAPTASAATPERPAAALHRAGAGRLSALAYQEACRRCSGCGSPSCRAPPPPPLPSVARRSGLGSAAARRGAPWPPRGEPSRHAAAHGNEQREQGRGQVELGSGRRSVVHAREAGGGESKRRRARTRAHWRRGSVGVGSASEHMTMRRLDTRRHLPSRRRGHQARRGGWRARLRCAPLGVVHGKAAAHQQVGGTGGNADRALHDGLAGLHERGRRLALQHLVGDGVRVGDLLQL